jgi:hypothetical protein
MHGRAHVLTRRRRLTLRAYRRSQRRRQQQQPRAALAPHFLSDLRSLNLQDKLAIL